MDAEARLDAWAATDGSGWRPTGLTAALRDDLRDLDLPPVTGSGLAIADRSAALGVGYVLEGSAFGARILAQRAASLGFDASHGARHLDRQSASLDNWRAFLAELESCEPFDMDAAAEAANATFREAQAAFDEVAPAHD